MDGSSANTSNSQAEVRPSIIPPLFDGSNTSLFFLKLERYFKHNGINDTQLRFTVAVNCITSSEFSTLLENSIRNAEDNEDPYSVLKQKIIDETTPSPDLKLKRLLSTQKLGNSTCAHFLENIMSNVPSDHRDSPFIKEIFLQGIPADVRAILTMGTYENIDSMAKAADKVILAKGEVREVNSLQSNISVDVIASQMSQLSSKLISFESKLINIDNRLSKLEDQSRKSRYSRSRSYSQRPNRNNNNNSKMCYYHKKFAEKATKCVQPCSYNLN